jgi:D-sedoheptulose 7-phosphate isomerase
MPWDVARIPSDVADVAGVLSDIATMPCDHVFDDAGQYSGAYFNLLRRGAEGVETTSISRAAAILDRVIDDRSATVFVCGNGGSAAISNHLHCDFLKGIQSDTDRLPRVISLAGSIETITAIANDIAYAEVFLYALRTMARSGDALITVSSSGNSENVVRAVEWARDNGVWTIALTGFKGGRTACLADVNIHVPVSDYGVVEDLHQSVMHILAQFLRQKHLNRTRLSKTG